MGITGTNGKTSTTYLLEAILASAGRRVGVIGTVNYRAGQKTWPAPVTTPESLDLQRLLRAMRADGVSHVCMEVSSHALDLHRVDRAAFDVGVFTNLSQDHLDYHRDLDDYFAAKSRLFLEILANGGGPRPGGAQPGRPPGARVAPPGAGPGPDLRLPSREPGAAADL